MGIAGDPDAVVTAADTITRAAGAFTDTADAVGSHGRAVTSFWEGSAADAAGSAIAQLSTRTRVGATVLGGIAPVLRTYAAALRAAQAAYADATARSATAGAAVGSAQSSLDAAESMATTDVTGATDPSAVAAQADARTRASTALSAANSALVGAGLEVAAALAAAQQANADAAAAIDALTDQLTSMSSLVGAGQAATSTAPARHWWQDAWNTVSGAAGAAADTAWQWASGEAQDIAAQAESVVDFYAANPEQLSKTAGDAALTAFGLLLVDAGAGTEVGGVALDLTGVGAVVGVPANVLGAGLITAGVGLGGVGAAGLGQDLNTLNEGRRIPDSSQALHDGTMYAEHSTALGKNLEDAGVARPAGSAAHHIVAWGSPKALPAQEVLQKYGIDIDAADNGVFLPKDRLSPLAGTGPATHASLHTDTYHKAVNQALGKATSRQDAINIIDELRSDLQDGWAPR